MLNVRDLSLNDFEVLDGQELLMKELDDKYDSVLPLIMIDGVVNLMMDTAVYASMLIMEPIIAEKNHMKEKKEPAGVRRAKEEYDPFFEQEHQGIDEQYQRSDMDPVDELRLYKIL